MEAFIHTSVPRIYQVSNIELQPSSEPNHPLIQIIVNNFKYKALIDSGASISYCKLSVAEKIGKINFDLMPNTKAKVANGGEFFMIGKINVNIEIDHIKISTQIFVAKDEFCPCEILLGSDFMKQLQINTGK
uniref:Retropepsins domain-containing protein n=1 Tax=Meloidogyne incognita TaxID=6306 RepID=A0A914NLG5_MELIC